MIKRRVTCRVCGGSDLTLVLSLGDSPLANAFLSSPDQFDAEMHFPLDLYACRTCSLLQLLDVVDPAFLFRHYLYVTGMSSGMARHHLGHVRALAERVSLGPGDLVVDIASNDGSLLRSFASLGVRTLGVEPAANLAALATEGGVETISEFFSPDLASRIVQTYGPARVISAANVLAHVDDPGEFLVGCRVLIADGGVISIEVPYAGDLLDRVEYDTVYHEHLSYFSVRSLLMLCDRSGLSVLDVERMPVHGGSMRLLLSATGADHATAVRAVARDEDAHGLSDLTAFRRFAEAVVSHRAALVSLLERLTAEGKVVVGYGAPAKGTTRLNYCGIGTRLLPFTVDRNPMKVGLYMPGSHIPIRDVSALLSSSPVPDYVLILPWNIADEIMAQEGEYRERGGQFILPVPEPRIAR